ncbi:MAG: hypothetical protein PHD13_05845 [Methanocellales archaeon]|nr:hypothetical protein [Methanocellales archaeon]MDD3292039.1 hypothetical protein [Methanocellales archaeon]MDD5235678.1 hypothetical protein [Methanocellales archaeon]MDD5485604.1 hypothetical protein [Methanocellales archaeon]
MLGSNAESMMGEQVESSGHFNVLKVETTLKVHFVHPRVISSSTTKNLQKINSVQNVRTNTWFFKTEMECCGGCVPMLDTVAIVWK